MNNKNIMEEKNQKIEKIQNIDKNYNLNMMKDLLISRAFPEYIKAIISKNERYEIVEQPEKLSIRADLILKDNISGQYKVCEIKTNTIYTQERINSIRDSINEYKMTLSNEYANIQGVFIFLGKLSLKNQQFLKKDGIEIWDREYIVSHFRKEIEEINNPDFNKVLKIIEFIPEKVLNEYDEKIKKLKKCEPGTEHWNEYQILVGEIIELLFCPQLEKPLQEIYDRSRINRRDYIMPNYCQEDFWQFMRQNYCADYIVIDAKNSARGVKKQDILQIANYLKKHRNRFICTHFC